MSSTLPAVARVSAAVGADGSFEDGERDLEQELLLGDPALLLSVGTRCDVGQPCVSHGQAISEPTAPTLATLWLGVGDLTSCPFTQRPLVHPGVKPQTYPVDTWLPSWSGLTSLTQNDRGAKKKRRSWWEGGGENGPPGRPGRGKDPGAGRAAWKVGSLGDGASVFSVAPKGP